MKEIEINTLLLSGGGTKVAASVGALEKAYKSDLFCFDLNHIVCLSAGTLLGLCLMLGYSFDEIKQELLTVNISNLTNIQLGNFFKDWGVESGVRIIKWVESLIIKKGSSPRITFGELFKIFPVKYTIIVYNLSKVKYEFFNYLNTPDVHVIDAISYSMNIPLFFTKKTFKGDVMIDGGVLSNCPYDIFNTNISNVCCENDLKKLLAINIACDDYFFDNEEIDSLMTYIFRIYIIMSIKLDKKNIDHPYVINILNYKLRFYDFDSSDTDTILDLIKYGENSYETFEKNLKLSN